MRINTYLSLRMCVSLWTPILLLILPRWLCKHVTVSRKGILFYATHIAIQKCSCCTFSLYLFSCLFYFFKGWIQYISSPWISAIFPSTLTPSNWCPSPAANHYPMLLQQPWQIIETDLCVYVCVCARVFVSDHRRIVSGYSHCRLLLSFALIAFVVFYMGEHGATHSHKHTCAHAHTHFIYACYQVVWMVENNSQTEQNFSFIERSCLVNHRSARVAAL